MLNRSPLINLCNSAGKLIQRTGLPFLHLEAEDFLRKAKHQTGLGDFGDDVFHEPLRILLKACKEEARLTLIGHLSLRADILRFLTNRLRLMEDRKRYRFIALQKISQPIFIVGMPRTGSTLLHSLLGQDPTNRVPSTWEVMFPSPSPEYGKFEDDPRIAHTNKLLKYLDRLTPNFKAIHPMDAKFPTECVGILGHTFASFHFRNMYHIPSYQKWLNEADLGPAYLFHRQFLQHLQSRWPAERWVLKAPPHLFSLKAIFEAYPDARLIQTHRHPESVIPSVANLDATLRYAFSDHQDLPAIGRENLHHFGDHLDRAMSLRDSPGPWQTQFLDVDYRNLMKDPIGQIRRIYYHFGLTLHEEAVTKMKHFLIEEPKDKRGIHGYSLEKFGMTSEMIHTQFDSYITRFKLDSSDS